MKVLVTQSGLNLCDPVDCNPPVPLPTEFLRQEYWSGLPFTSPEELPNPGVDPGLLHCKKIVLQGSPRVAIYLPNLIDHIPFHKKIQFTHFWNLH